MNEPEEKIVIERFAARICGHDGAQTILNVFVYPKQCAFSKGKTELLKRPKNVCEYGVKIAADASREEFEKLSGLLWNSMRSDGLISYDGDDFEGLVKTYKKFKDDVADRLEKFAGMYGKPEETWRPIEGSDGKYEVSDAGRVRSFKKSKRGKARILKQFFRRKNEYLYVELSFEGKSTKKYIHRLVADAFIPKTEGKPLIDHINGIKTDNRACNLRRCTNQENMSFPLAKANCKKAQECRMRPVVQLDAEGNELDRFESVKAAARAVGARSIHISKCCYGKSAEAAGFKWKFVRGV